MRRRRVADVSIGGRRRLGAPRPVTDGSRLGVPALGAGIALGNGVLRGGALFEDYCAATGQPPLPTTSAVVAGFLAALPARPETLRRRLRTIAAAHRRAGWSAEHLRPDLTPASHRRSPGRSRGSAGWAPGESHQGVDAGRAIAACPTRGWPGGFTGRRDAFLLVLVEVLGRTYGQARRLTPTEITSGVDGLFVGAAAVPASGDPRTCPACAVARWLEVCDLADGLGQAIARELLTAAAAPTTSTDHAPHHDRWRQVRWLVIGIDPHGWLQAAEPLSARSISTRLAAARAAHPDTVV